MMLLNLTVRNHKSIRDEITIDLTRPSLRTLLPKDGNWHTTTYPLVGIFGGNATGKSAVLDACRYVFTAINRSATTWQESKYMRRAPFDLDEHSRHEPSMYELGLVHEGRRYEYGFEVDQDGIKREWLRDVPTSRWRTLLERDRDANIFTFHQSLGAKIEVTPRELVLSRALLLKGASLSPFAHNLVDSFDIVLVKDSHRTARLSNLADSLADGDVTFDDLEALLQIADIGVVKVDVEETNIPERLRRAIRRFERDIRKDGEQEAEAEPSQDGNQDDNQDELEADELEQVARRLTFIHHGTRDNCPPFSVADESDGTIAWLTIAVPALEILRQGGLLLVDEIDASLHPHLLEVLLGAFANPLINVHQAQLIFTSHESYILSPLSEVQLEPEQIWLTDKTYDGATELTCLSEFPKHPDANMAKRYLTGRYGGTPRLSPSLFAALIDVVEDSE